jgi:GMP synthase (glutamine-hydrolysing)
LTKEGASSCLGALRDDDAVVLHWHGDSFDLPVGASRLASNHNYENQAFAYGHNALALQFHLEAESRQLEEWYVGHAVELAAAGISVTELRAQTLKHKNSLASRAERIFSHWLRQISLTNTMPRSNVRA